ncbi:MAG: hypothetical protein JOZ05_12615, partial [Acetobacteraceae bacterium]|nr:hypothetical protein [Acetobacteraceae bacterium]
MNMQARGQMPSPNRHTGPSADNGAVAAPGVIPANDCPAETAPAAPTVQIRPPAPPERAADLGVSVQKAGPPPEQHRRALQNSAQRAAFDQLNLALQEGEVFAALTGPAGAGKSAVLDAVLADPVPRKLRIIRVVQADQISADLAEHIQQVAYIEATKPENTNKHVVLAVDDAHAASDELMRCLTRLAAAKRAGQRLPQVFLVGRPELWTRLRTPEYEPLARRIAIRPTIQHSGGEDPWSLVEQELAHVAARPAVPASSGFEKLWSAPAETPPGPPPDLAAVLQRQSDYVEPARRQQPHSPSKTRVLLPVLISLVMLGAALSALAAY